MGAKPYSIIEQYQNDMTDSIVEIGSERNEGSTTFLYNFATQHNLPFFTIDFNKQSYQNAKQITSSGCAQHMMGEMFLSKFFPRYNQKISFAYLDNFDLITYDGRKWDQRIKLYQNYGLSMNNTNSQIAHMSQAMLVAQCAASKCLIVIDDTWQDQDHEGDGTHLWEGKGALAVPVLKRMGFKLLNQPTIGNEEEGLKSGYVVLGQGY